jgi:phosphoglycolate phosphatase
VYKSILFDLDGTLTDPREGIIKSVCHALQKEGYSHPPESELTWVIGPPLRGSFQQLTKGDEAVVSRLLGHYRDRFAPIGLFENKVFPDIPQVLATLRTAGFDLYLATSKPAVYAKRILEHFQLTTYFTDIGGSELDGTREDKAEVIEDIVQKNGLDVSECVMIGDREHDIYGAKKNKMDAVGVLYGFGSAEELTRAGAIATLATPRDLLHYLIQ